MNQVPNIEVEKKKKVLESTACCRACFKQRKQLADEIVKELEQDLHHQLQKAREEERGRILTMIGHLPYISEDEYKKFKEGGIVKWKELRVHFEDHSELTQDKN